MDKVESPPNCFIPTQFFKTPNDEGEHLRHHLIMMLIFHLFFMIMFEIWLWENFVGMAFFLDFVYLYLAFAGMMTCNKLFVFVYIGFMFGSTPLYFWIVIGNVGGFWSVVFCLLEMIMFAYAGGFITLKRLCFFMNSAPGWTSGSSGYAKNLF